MPRVALLITRCSPCVGLAYSRSSIAAFGEPPKLSARCAYFIECRAHNVGVERSPHTGECDEGDTMPQRRQARVHRFGPGALVLGVRLCSTSACTASSRSRNAYSIAIAAAEVA